LIGKAIGLVLVFCAFLGMGGAMAKGVRKEWQIAGELQDLVRRIGSDVRCYKRPLPEIYDHYQGNLPKLFLEKLKKGDTEGAFSLLAVDPAVQEACYPFFERVGRCSAEECERFRQECDGELGRLIEQKKDEVIEKSKVYRGLGFAGAAAAVILLL